MDSVLSMIAEINAMARARNELSSAQGSVDYAKNAFAMRQNHLLKIVRDIQNGTQEYNTTQLALEILESKKFEDILSSNVKALEIAEQNYRKEKDNIYSLALRIKG